MNVYILDMYVTRYTSLCMHVWVYMCIHVCLHVCMHVYHVYSHVTVHIFDATEKIWLPHCKYDPHSRWAYRPKILHMSAKNWPNETTSHVIAIYGSAKYMPLIMPHIKLVHVYTWTQNQYKYLTAIQNVTRSTAIHTFHIIGIASWTNNMPATLHM